MFTGTEAIIWVWAPLGLGVALTVWLLYLAFTSE